MNEIQHAAPFGPFYLERRLAVGGTAEVYLARPKLGVRPAPQLVVKRLLPATRQTSDFDVLEREASLHQAVHHPNVVEVYGAGLVNDEPYIALEYVEGVDLYRLLRQAEAEGRTLPAALACYVTRRIALALAAVHAARDDAGRSLNIVHRDVTPSNVYLSRNGEVKVGDFGIARASHGQPERQGLKGKFGYLAPEQVAGEPFDHRADLFASCVLLGEMLVGERIFPGGGQLAILLAIRDGNIERLRRARGRLPEGLYELCVRGLSRDPERRFATAGELAEALEPYEEPSPALLQEALSEWVRRAADPDAFAKQLQGKIRDSVKAMKAVRAASSSGLPAEQAGAFDATEPQPQEKEESDFPDAEATLQERPWLAAVGAHGGAIRVQRSSGEELTVEFPRLLEMLATGQLEPTDMVAMGDAGELLPLSDIPDLCRLLLPSSAATTASLSGPGVPDYHALLADTSMVAVLARMRRSSESGVLFVSRHDADGEVRKEIYLQRGHLHHVASTERGELLGEYLVRRGSLTRAQLEEALGELGRMGGKLGDRLLSLGVVDAMSLFRAIRDQGRDRVAALCGWEAGSVSFYRGTEPGRVDFPLDLDLTSPMMAGAIVRGRGDARAQLPSADTPLLEGARLGHTAYRAERGTAPISLQMIPDLVSEGLTVGALLARLTEPREGRDSRVISDKEAVAALLTAEVLEWVRFPGRSV